MKNLRLKIIATTILIAASAYIITDAITAAKERVYRMASGESEYERTHRKRK